jgi:putative addiction module component (TIGR02574 family)
MVDFAQVLSAACELTDTERIRLINALWSSLSDDAEAEIPEEWAKEIERRVAELESGMAETIPWSKVRDAALSRVMHGKGN